MTCSTWDVSSPARGFPCECGKRVPSRRLASGDEHGRRSFPGIIVDGEIDSNVPVDLSSAFLTSYAVDDVQRSLLHHKRYHGPHRRVREIHIEAELPSPQPSFQSLDSQPTILTQARASSRTVFCIKPNTNNIGSPFSVHPLVPLRTAMRESDGQVRCTIRDSAGQHFAILHSTAWTSPQSIPRLYQLHGATQCDHLHD
jgi:hypothetical protein